MATTSQRIEQLTHSRVVDETGDKVGDVARVYLDDDTGNPSWVTVRTGLFGTRETFIPLRGSRQDGDDLFVPYSKRFIKDAPNFDDDGGAHLDGSAQDQLFSYYGVGHQDAGDGGQDAPGDRGPQREPVDELGHPHLQERDVRDRDRHPGEYRTQETAADAAGAQTDRDRTYETQRVVQSTSARQGADRGDTRMRLRRHVVTQMVPDEREVIEVVDEHGNTVGRLDDDAVPDADRERNVGGP